MSDETLAAATLATLSVHDGPSTIVFYLAVICLIWYVAVTLVSTLGYVQVRRYFSRAPAEVAWSQDAPHVNIIRPVKVNARETRYKHKIATRDAKLTEREAELSELRSKMEHMEKMYKSMGAELMRAWGREEFGDTGDKQKYRYKYAKAAAA